MAGVLKTARLSARVASRYASRPVVRRGFQVSAQDRAAQNYPMPALSPTMTEGNIASWKLKEGDSFSAGDVLLEIETDKATMDVEAQDDGILMKIMQGDGAKGVKVGDRIAVTAEPGDDIGSMQLPADDSSPQQGQKSAGGAQKGGEEENVKKSQQSAPEQQPPTPIKADNSKQGGTAQKQKYPLYPSVQHLLHQNGLSSADAEKIPASGPQGRLLKGDVLAFLGKIKKEYPAQSSARLQKLSHLDLSNIQLAKKAEAKPEQPKEKKPEPELPQETEIAIPISLSQVIATQKRVQDSLGIFLPLSTFIARASELANDDLPVSTNRKPTADDLFNSVLGLDKVPRSSRGHFFPNIAGLSPAPLPARPAKKADIIDILAPKQTKPKTPKSVIPAAAGISASENIFSLVVGAGEENRATEYLERMKLALEKEPGRLVL